MYLFGILTIGLLLVFKTKADIEKCYSVNGGESCFLWIGNSSANIQMLQTWQEASTSCSSRGPGYSLLTITSKKMQDVVEQFFLDVQLISDNVWLAAMPSDIDSWTWLNDVGYQGTFLPQCSLMPSPPPLPQVLPPPPPPPPLSADNKTGYLQQCQIKFDKFSNPHGYICQYHMSNPKCNDSSAVVNNDMSSCYIASGIQQQCNWYQARNFCLRSNGDLAALDPKVVNISKFQQNTDYWIGLHKNRWIWQNSGCPLAFTYFNGGDPNADDRDYRCLALSFDNQWLWTSRICSQHQLVVCVRGNTTMSKCQQQPENRPINQVDMRTVLLTFAAIYIVTIILTVGIVWRHDSKKKMIRPLHRPPTVSMLEDWRSQDTVSTISGRTHEALGRPQSDIYDNPQSIGRIGSARMANVL